MTLRSVAAVIAAVPLVTWSAGTVAAHAAANVGPAASPGCNVSKAGPRDQRVTTTAGGTPRGYFEHVPPANTGTRALPLVLDLHGTSEPAAIHKANSGLAAFGDKHGFVTITPEGSGPVPHWDTRFDSADMKFLSAVLDEAEQSLCIDQRRVFVAGYSNGAFMASAMACAYSNRIAAVAPVAGIRDVPGCKPARPVPVVAFHGRADQFVSFNGGLGPGVTNLPATDRQMLIDVAAPSDSGRSIPDTTSAWATRNGCAPNPKQQPVASDVTLLRFACPNHADVQLYEINGAGHTWPGSQFSKAIEQYVGKTTFSIDADTIMWKFFQQHPLPGRS